MKDIKPIINKLLPELIELRHSIHENPELGFQEVETAQKVVDAIGGLPNITLQTGVATTGVVAVLGAGKKGPCVALRADMDCLPITEETGKPYASKKPGLMHACGHDGHTTCLVGAVKVLSEIQDELAGPVKFIFQPSEEKDGGANVMCNEGVLEEPKVDAIFGFHGHPYVSVKKVALTPGESFAGVSRFTIKVIGKGGHAAFPTTVINPVLIGAEIVTAINSIITQDISPVEPALIAIGRFEGGTVFNVIPNSVTLEGTARYFHDHNRDIIEKRITEICETTANRHGGSVEIEMLHEYPPLINDKKAAAYMTSVAESVFGKENVDSTHPPVMGAEDFAYFAQKAPATFWYLGLCPDGREDNPFLHDSRFDFTDEAIPYGIELHCESVRRFSDYSSS